ncbi:hypothetical protein NRA36_17585, partial [Acinetobacter baumannii]|nr:hypothetical protein [Acinetobacter baumannii]
MSAGLQVYNINGELVFDSTVHTVISRIKTSTRTFTKVSGGNYTYETSISDIPNANMRDYIFKVISHTYYAVSSTWIDEVTGNLKVNLSDPSSASSIDFVVKVYR